MPNEINHNIHYKEFNFDVIRAHIQMVMNKRDCNDVLFNLQINDSLEQLKIHFWKEYVGATQEKRIEFFVPKTWKDHFKKTHRHKKWMKWWILRHPIKNKKLSFKINKITIFPEVEVPKKPEFINHFNYLEVIHDDS